MPGVLNVFTRWWLAVMACIGPSGGNSNNASSPSKKPTCAPQSTPCSVPPSIGQGKPHPGMYADLDPPSGNYTTVVTVLRFVTDTVNADTHRERFLRHPSVTSSDGATRMNTSSSTAGKTQAVPQARNPVQEVRPDIAPAFRAHDWSSPSYRPNPPRRPPRPPSILLPAVIITPCTPEGMTHPNFEAILATPESPLDKTIAAYRIASSVAAYGDAGASGRSNTTLAKETEYQTTHRPPPTYGRIPGTDPPHKEHNDAEDPRDAVVQAPDPVEARGNRVAGRVFVSSKLRSFIVPETIPSNLERPVAAVGSDSSSRSSFDQYSDTPPWIFSLSFEQLAGLKPLTSTPTKHRLAESDDTESMNPDAYSFRRSEDTSGTALSLRLPDEQEDLLPYPDVFDLELYYGLGSGRLSISRDGSSSIIRCSVDEKNVFLPGPASVIPTTRRYGYIVAAYSQLSVDHVNDENVPPNMHQDRGRARSRHDAYHLPIFDRRSVSTPTRLDSGAGKNDDSLPVFRPRTAVLSTPGSSTLASPGCDSGRHVLLPIPLREQIQQRTRSGSDPALEMFPSPTHTHARSRVAQVQEPSFDTPSPLPGGPGKTRAYTYTTSKTYTYGPPDIPLPPIVIVSSVSASDQSHPAHNVYKDVVGRGASHLSEASDTHDVVAGSEESTSPEALRSRLQATFNYFSRPMGNASWVDECDY